MGKRKPNFREDDILCLVEGITNETVVIMSKRQSSITNQKKKEVWREINAKVIAFGVVVRAVSEWGQSGDDSDLGWTIARIPKTPAQVGMD